MTLPAKHHFVLGTAFHAPVWGEVEVLADALFEINAAGTLERVLLPRDADYAKAVDDARANGELEELSATQYLLPGFVDLHIHAPQWENIGNALHVPLEDWLQKHTFPLEQSLTDGEKAAPVFADLVMRSLANGTTTALYYGTQNVDATVLLGEVCQTLGQRAAIGKVVMDNPEQCPDYYRDASADAGIAGTEETIERIMALTDERQLLTPVITPRFVPSCTPAALKGLGELAERYPIPIQTHLSESDWQAGYAHEHFGTSDAEVLDSFGLLTNRAVMGHATQLTEDEAELVAQRGATISHCPISNAFFGNAVYPVRRRHAQGVKAGLGTDVSGGFAPSIYANIRQAIISSRMLEDGVDANLPAASRGVAESRIDFRHAFYMATTAGGEALHQNIGLFLPGYHWDVQLIDVAAPHSDIVLYSEDDAQSVLQKILFTANRANITKVWVQGQLVSGR